MVGGADALFIFIYINGLDRSCSFTGIQRNTTKKRSFYFDSEQYIQHVIYVCKSCELKTVWGSRKV